MNMKEFELVAGSSIELKWLRGEYPWSCSNYRSKIEQRVAMRIRNQLIRKLNEKFRKAGLEEISLHFELGLCKLSADSRWKSRLICTEVLRGIELKSYVILSTLEPGVEVEKIAEAYQSRRAKWVEVKETPPEEKT